MLCLPSGQISLLANAICLQARHFVSIYQRGWLTCEDPACKASFRGPPPAAPVHNNSISDHTSDDMDELDAAAAAYQSHHLVDVSQHTLLWSSLGPSACPLCASCAGQTQMRQRYSETQLYRQLLFYRHLLAPISGSTVSSGCNYSSVANLNLF
ncbi:unnamed protein product [Protopolystoma xenopodis]|uniref:Zinc finger DNA-directed DNA polymerase family B alpha domain-containing protein n=1 Tax=Protopolystoma xenopodis TaxID=117903 RepID=A0A3S5AX42_9PLAT|nr:unnamed protein product [Protopolystoma xenopodis]